MRTGAYCMIPLTRGMFAKVDPEDFQRLIGTIWCASRGGGGGFYAERRVRGRIVKMHRDILGLQRGDRKEVDHINGDSLDNRRCNLRVCTHEQNLRNQKLSVKNTSRFKGVVWDKSRQKWAARIKVRQKMINLGRFDSIDLARIAYRQAAQKHHGEFARVA